MPTSAGTTTSSWPASNEPCPIFIVPTLRSCRRSRATPATGTRAKGTGHDRRPAHPLPRARAPLPDRRLGGAAQRGSGDGPAPRTRRRRRDRPAVAVRGGDPRRGGRADPLARTGHERVRRGARLLPGRPVVRGHRRPVRGRPGARQGVRRHPGHRQPEREHRGRLGRPMRGGSRTPGRTHWSSTCTTSRRIRGGPRPTSRRRTSTSSRPCAPRSRSRSRSS